MKAKYFKIPERFHQSISIRKDTLSYFDDDWHYHSQQELVYILKGTGTRFIGDNISRFKNGDLILLGSNLPHVWKSDKQYFSTDSNEKVSAIVLHFPLNFGGDEFWKLPEMTSIKKLLHLSHMGINYTLPPPASNKEAN